MKVTNESPSQNHNGLTPACSSQGEDASPNSGNLKENLSNIAFTVLDSEIILSAIPGHQPAFKVDAMFDIVKSVTQPSDYPNSLNLFWYYWAKVTIKDRWASLRMQKPVMILLKASQYSTRSHLAFETRIMVLYYPPLQHKSFTDIGENRRH
ncbi:hypothetical protein HOY80DRAFT_1026849 [Tuber brumale]|nr:hypothetical protein HOY80DRAFT_1026849 [Tuber brumale]